jgi:hypothetical protein
LRLLPCADAQSSHAYFQQGLAILACHQAVRKHSGRSRLVSGPIYFPVGTSSGASGGQPHPISRCSVNLPRVYISVHPRTNFVVASQCDHCYGGKVECSISVKSQGNNLYFLHSSTFCTLYIAHCTLYIVLCNVRSPLIFVLLVYS